MCVFLFFRFLFHQAQNPIRGIRSASTRPFPSHRSSCRPRVCSFFYLPRLEEQIKSFVLCFSSVFLCLCFPFSLYCFLHLFFHVFLFIKLFSSSRKSLKLSYNRLYVLLQRTSVSAMYILLFQVKRLFFNHVFYFDNAIMPLIPCV